MTPEDAATPATDQPAPDRRSVSQIEADIASTRQRLAETVDHLATAAQPSQIARRQVEGAKASLVTATRTETGEVRIERVAAVAAAALAVLAFVVLRRRRG